MFGGARDDSNTIFYGGFVSPAIFISLVILNLCTGKVYLLARRGVPRLLEAYDDPWRFWGTVAIKLGFAVALFGWYFLGNRRRIEHLYIPTSVIGVVIAALGLIALGYGFFA